MSLQVQSHPTPRAPDGWESPHFQAVCVAWSWFRQNGVISSRPPAGNAHRWAANKEHMKFQVLLSILTVVIISSCSLSVKQSNTSEVQTQATPEVVSLTSTEQSVASETQVQFTQEVTSLATEDFEEVHKSTFRLGQDGERKAISTVSFIDSNRDTFTVLIFNTYDPLPNAKDDEIRFAVVIQSSDPSRIPTGEFIDIPSEKIPITVVVGAFCFCGSIPLTEGSGQHIPAGKVYFEKFTEEEVQGNAQLHIKGDIPYFSADEPFYEDLWLVNTSLELEILYFGAVPRE